MEQSIRKSREICMQLLYTLEESEFNIDDYVNIFMSTFKVNRKNMCEYIKKSKKIFIERNNFDSYLESVSQEYSLDRIAKVDLAILRVILYEIDADELPIEVAIAEALRLAKKFSSYGSGKYLHAMIDSIYKVMMHEEKSAL